MTAYYLAATLARFGDEMVAFTLVLLVLDRTDSPALAGITGAFYALPAIVTGPLLGAWLDRTRYRRTALTLNQTVLGAVMLTMLAVVGNSPAWITPALAAVAGLTLPLVSGGFTSMLPFLVPQSRLARANSLEAASFSAATIAGPATAATITAAVSVDASAIVIAVIAVLSILAITRLPALAAGEHDDDFIRSVLAGLRHLAVTPRLRASTVTTTVLLGLTGMLLITLPLHMASVGAPESAAGYLWAAVEVGSVTTAVLLGWLQTRFKPECVLMISVAAYGLVLTSWPFASSLAVLLVLAVAAGLVEGPTLPAMFAARQQYSPESLQGRVSTSAASLRIGAAALGQAAGGLLVPVLGTSRTLTLIGGGLVAAAGFGWLASRTRTPELAAARG